MTKCMAVLFSNRSQPSKMPRKWVLYSKEGTLNASSIVMAEKEQAALLARPRWSSSRAVRGRFFGAGLPSPGPQSARMGQAWDQTARPEYTEYNEVWRTTSSA